VVLSDEESEVLVRALNDVMDETEEIVTVYQSDLTEEAVQTPANVDEIASCRHS